MKFTIDEIIKATGAIEIKCRSTAGTFAVSTDTRTISYNDIYLPLSGENFDGHDFIKTALDNGARGYFTSNKKLKFNDANIILYVENTLIAYLKLARYYKQKRNPVTIAITGSSGKTTTKEMMASVITQCYKTHKSQLNHNNEVGLCQTMLNMPADSEVLIIEMGMRGEGEIELLSTYSQPDIAVIVNTGTAHIGRLGSTENIAKAKCEITKSLHEEGLLIAHDTELIKKANKFKGQTIYTGLESKQLKILSMKKNSSEFEYRNCKFLLNEGGKYNIQNALFVIETAIRLGMPYEKIVEGLANYHPIGQRWEIEKIKNFKVINDSYNANPESVKAAMSAFLDLYPGEKYVVLGDMGELGKNEVSYHEEVGEFLSGFKNVKLITVGKLAKNIAEKTLHDSKSFTSNKGVAKYIFENIPEGTTILFKASRSMKFEQIIEELKNL